MNSGDTSSTTPSAPAAFGPGLDDIVLLPVVLVAVAARRLVRAALSLLMHLLDYLFPLLLQLMRFPLFTLRIVGDGLARLAQAIVGLLPLPGDRSQAWREALKQGWAWLRQRISYHAFEESVHHAFEAGMAWVFRNCKTLTPRTALLVIVAAVLWIPISFGAATAAHAVLIAKAATLPSWMQLLHGVATILAKSKLLVLPVYPAAWPQARQHPFVGALSRLCRQIADLPMMQKLGLRYRQTDSAMIKAFQTVRRTARSTGLAGLCRSASQVLRASAATVGAALGKAAAGLVHILSRAPLVGPVVTRYAEHYRSTHTAHPETISQRTKSFFDHWSVKFTAEYYEAREAAEAAAAGASPGGKAH
ncbi:hypothetical protein [Phreatobacter stygius]|uniref:Uncharacterized protein n=1 Tax=Phreatobacter stygius TaxID=1940610 RepID=A0A4D7B1S4_9HYPH|nr:hypothetical protein [Phreatobacter stygius]QCI67554.1 hypothetical protein E8M01_27025 [Phreatobacter stygius]